MLKAFCDRCREEIPNYDAEKQQLSIIDGNGMIQETFDLCHDCLLVISEKLRDFIKGGT